MTIVNLLANVAAFGLLIWLTPRLFRFAAKHLAERDGGPVWDNADPDCECPTCGYPPPFLPPLGSDDEDSYAHTGTVGEW